MTARVLIVREGQWGTATPESYEQFIEALRETLERAERTGPNNTKEKAAKVEVVETWAEAEKRLETAPLNLPIHTVVFVSRDMGETAKRMASKYPRTRIVVFTGLIPEGEVVWVDKWLLTTGQAAIDAIVLP